MPLLEVIKKHPRGLLIAMGARIGTDVAYYTFSSYILVYLVDDLRLPKAIGLDAVLLGSAGQLLLIPLFGALSDRLGRRPVYAVGAVSAAAWSFLFFPLLNTRSTSVIILATVAALATHAVMYGPQAAFIAELFSTRLRYSGASMDYQLAGVLGGGIAPIVSIALVKATGTAFAVSGYVLAMTIITLVTLWFAPETARVDLHTEQPDARQQTCDTSHLGDRHAPARTDIVTGRAAGADRATRGERGDRTVPRAVGGLRRTTASIRRRLPFRGLRNRPAAPAELNGNLDRSSGIDRP
jgi:MFS family permease